MRAGGSRAEFRTPDFDEHNRLAALGCELGHFEKFIGFFEALCKTGNDPGIRIVEQIAGEIGKIEVCLVPSRDDIAEADAVLDRPHQEWPERRRTTLAYEANRPGQTRRTARGSGGPDVVFDIREPE